MKSVGVTERYTNAGTAVHRDRSGVVLPGTSRFFVCCCRVNPLFFDVQIIQIVFLVTFIAVFTK